MKPEHKEKVLEEVVGRVVANTIKNSEKITLDTVINDTIYHERKRLEGERKTRARARALLYWKKINKKLISEAEFDREALLKELVTLFAQEIVGNFNPKVYQFTTRFLPIALNTMLNTVSPRTLFAHFPRLPDLSNRLIIRGEISALQKLKEKGTILLVPTHSSNMDSIIVGMALHKINLPPFVYGAGINLFTNYLISYFMNNLGAYKIDRKKTAKLYKDTLKEYATCTMEYGYHNLFFPGGTRSRSGAIEDQLKLGLLGSGLRAYVNNLKNGKENPNLYLVPCTINYQLVLEAEHLIDDQLKATGKSKYIIENDEFSQPRRIVNFLTSILRLDSRIYVNFCPAMDLFGNSVDEEGISYDKRGRPVDIARYTWVDGKVTHDQQRDREFIRTLEENIKESYRNNNVIMSTNLLAFVVFCLMKKHNPTMDLYRLLRTGGKEDNLPIREVYESLESVLTQIHSLEKKKKICLDEKIKNASVDSIIEEACKHFRIYHTKIVLYRQGDRIYPNDPNLIYYYHNRLIHYDLEKATYKEFKHAEL